MSPARISCMYNICIETEAIQHTNSRIGMLDALRVRTRRDVTPSHRAHVTFT